MNGRTLAKIFIVAAAAGGIFWAAKNGAFSPTDPEGATETLTSNGYDRVEIGGYGWGACGKDDYYATEFVARNIASNQYVAGVVCKGSWAKASTIRTY